MSPRNPEPSPEQRLSVILEELRSQFRTFGEGLTDVQEKASNISERLERVEEDTSIIKSAVSTIPTLATKKDLEKLEKRLTALETH